MKYITILLFVVVQTVFPLAANAEEDIFADYNKDMSKPADANVVGVYDAWGNNMAHRIKNATAKAWSLTAQAITPMARSMSTGWEM